MSINKKWYRNYLQSEYWLQKRREALNFYGNKCCDCGTTKNLNVHHVTYKNLGDEAMADLEILCGSCHQKEHDGGNLVKLREKEKFVKVFASEDSFPKCLKRKWSWIGYWLYLLTYHIETYTNLLILKDKDKAIIIDTQKSIANILDVSLKTAEKFLSFCRKNLLIKKGILGYYLNPYYGYNGEGIWVETLLLFKESKKLWDALTPNQIALIEEYQNKIKDLILSPD